VRSIEVPHVRGTIVPDGVLNEPDWQHAADTGYLIDTLTGRQDDPQNSRGRVKVLWGDQFLYVAFEIRDEHLVDMAQGPDSHLWEKDCAEIMVDPDGDGRNYFEMQVSPGGHVFDTRYFSRRVPRPFGDLAWDSHLIPGARANGTINNGSDTDEGYVTEIAIPWTSFDVPGAPHAGETWRMNFYLMDMRRSHFREQQAFAGWSAPMIGDFHVPDRFGRVTFR
jgi:hypothetical protein